MVLTCLLSLAPAAVAVADAPDTLITGGPDAGAYVDDMTPTFTFSSAEPGTTFKCKVDLGSWAACTSPKTTIALSQGEHTFSVKGTDPLLNEDPTPATRTFKVDTWSPTLSFVNSPAAGARTKDNTPTYHFDIDDASPVSLQCKVDTGNYAPCQAGSWSPAALGDGTHSVFAKATDAAGNVSSVVTRQIVVDTQAPAPALTSPAAVTNDSTPTFAFSAPHDGGGNYTFSCWIDSGVPAACNGAQSSSTFTAAQLADGAHTLNVVGVDSVGNASAAVVHAFTVDTVAPTVAITSDGAPFSFTTGGSPARVECSLDGGAFAPCASPYAPSSLATGSHKVEVRATDAAGNAGLASKSFAVATAELPYLPVKTGTVTSPTTTKKAAVRVAGKSKSKSKRRTCKRVVKLKSGKRVKRAVKCAKKTKKAKRAKKRR